MNEELEDKYAETLFDGLLWDWHKHICTDPVVYGCYQIAEMQNMSQVQWLEFMAFQLLSAKMDIERQYKRLLEHQTIQTLVVRR
jgi:hypothetical protein